MGVDPVGKVLVTSVGLRGRVQGSRFTDRGGHRRGDRDSQAEAAKRLVPYQSFVGMRQALDPLTADE